MYPCTVTATVESKLVLLSVADVARRLGVSSRTVWRLDAAGKLPRKIRLGGSARWRSDEIEGWIAVGCPARAKWEAMANQKGVS